MDIVKSSELKKGSAEIFIPPGKRYEFISENKENNVDIKDQNDMPLPIKGKSPGIIRIVTGSKVVWMCLYQETNHHPCDDVPTEQPIESPPDIMTRMRAIITEEVMNRYGANSEEMETLEESMDFDLNEDGHIGAPQTPYELPDEEMFIEEVISQPAEPAPQEPTQQTTEAEPAPPSPETTTTP